MFSQNFYNIALDCVDKHAQSYENKDKTALICMKEGGEVTRLTFSNLQGLTNRIANGLKNSGFQKGDRIIIYLPNCPEFPVMFLGAIKAGFIPIPVSPLLTSEELKFIVEDSGAKEVVSSQRWVQDLFKSSSSQFITVSTQADEPAYWLYTSGTEGKPKAVVHAHRSIKAHDVRTKVWQDFRRGDVIFNTSALNWSYALTAGLLDVWRHGLTSVIYEGKPDPKNLCEIIQKEKVTIFMSVPGIYRRLVESFEKSPQPPFTKRGGSFSSPLCKGGPGGIFSNVRVCNSAGEKLPEEIRNKFKEYTGLEIYEGLGMTEHSVYLVQPFGEPVVKDSCGKALPGQRIAVLKESIVTPAKAGGQWSQRDSRFRGNDNMTEAKAGEVGILASHRSCLGLMLGYRENPPLPPFYKGGLGGFFLSNDLAYQDEKGNFFFQGRKDDVITAGGYRISPLEVETVLNQYPKVLESAVVGLEENQKTFVAAFVVLGKEENQTSLLQEKIKSYMSEHLAKYKIPKKIIFVNALPKTANGKLKRKELF